MSPVLVFLSLLSSWISHSVDEHAIYLSMIEINHAAHATKASVKVKVFTNDIEDALTNEFEERRKLSEENSCELNKHQIEQYFRHHLSISVDKTLLNLSLQKCELLTDAIWFDFEVSCPEKWTSAAVKASFLMELFPTQSNVVSLIHNEKKQFANLTQAKTTEVFKF